MATQPIITRGVMTSMISLIDWVYRMGLDDACDADDEGLVREFCDKTSKAGVFGFLTDEFTITWQEWSLRLMAKARSTAWNGAMARYFNLAGKFGANYLSVFLNIAQCYYNMALKDYLKAKSVDRAMWHNCTRIRLTPKGVKNCKVREYIDTIQLLTFDLSRRDEEVWQTQTATQAKKIALTAKQYEMFRRSVGLVTVNNMGY